MHSTDRGFYLIWNPQRSEPTVAHSSYEDAAREAERLARKAPGESFYILKTVHRVAKQDVQVTPCPPDDEGIPF